jgi:hypothetical protein
MTSVVDDLESALELLAEDSCTDLDQVVVVEESPSYPGTLVFQPFDGDDQGFFETYSEWVSLYLILSEHHNFAAFVSLLEADGRTVLFGPSAAPILAAYQRWCSPIEVNGFTCPNGGQLYPFQVFGLNRALERSEAQKPSDRLTVPGWCAGAGKSVYACAGAQELANRGQIDVVLAFTLMRHKINLCRFFSDATRLNPVVVDGSKDRRRRLYAKDFDVFVLNYDKARFDFDELSALTRGQRVLFVLDECQKVLTAETRTQARRCLDDLIKNCHATVWPMTASIVGSSPLRYHNAFALAQTRDNPLGTRKDFLDRYCRSVKRYEVRTKHGGSYTQVDYEWDLAALHEVRHRVADRVQNARKGDPGVREFFPPLQVLPESDGEGRLIPNIQLSEQDRELYGVVEQLASRAKDAGEGLGPYYWLLRHICNTPEALWHSTSPLARFLREEYPRLCTSANSAKVEYFLDQVEGIADAGDKCIGFTKWTNLGLQILHRELDKRKIRHVLHHGEMSLSQSQAAQDKFRTDDTITLFLSSDAGAYGLNMREARYCIIYEHPYSWDDLMQRINRIHRSDSQLTGLTAYRYITDGTVEERIAAICEGRRILAEATLGTNEVLSLPETVVNRSEEANYSYLIFGES